MTDPLSRPSKPTRQERSTPFASGGRNRETQDWHGPDVLPELYTPAERTVRKHTLAEAERLAEWQVGRKLSKFIATQWGGALVPSKIEAPAEPMTRQELNEYAEKLSEHTVQRLNAMYANVRSW